MITIKDAELMKPFVVDVFKVTSDKSNQYDLPFYYFGQIVATSFKTKRPETQSILGSKNGYQHLWKEAEAKAGAKSIQFTWLNNKRFYSITSATNANDEILLARLGANDPKFNLRSDPAFIIRKNNTKETIFASIIESHGTYNPVTEKASNAYSVFSAIKVVINTENYTALELVYKSGVNKVLILSNTNASKEAKHILKINDKNYKWSGSYYFK
jgi:hypothetical protein